MSEEKDIRISKYDELIKSAEDKDLLNLIAKAAKEERNFRERFYSLTSEQEVVSTINNIVTNCTPETKQQLTEFLSMYQGASIKKMGVGDILGYLDTVSIYMDKLER